METKRIGKNKKKKFKALEGKLYEGNMSKISKNTKIKDRTVNKPSSSVTEKFKKKKRMKKFHTSESVNKFSIADSKLSKKPKEDKSNHVTWFSPSLLLNKKLTKNSDEKVSFSPKTITSYNSKKNKFLKRRKKKISSDSPNVSSGYSDKISKSKKIECLKLSGKCNPAKIHTKSKHNNIQIMLKNSRKYENTSDLSDEISEESENSCDEFNQYENQNNNEDDTDEDLEIRNELKSLNVYTELQKLHKDNTMSFSSFCDATGNNLVEMEETAESSSSDSNTSNESNKESCKNASKISKESSKFLSDSFKTNKHINKPHVDNVQIYQSENILQRDHPNKYEKRKCSSTLRNKAQEKLQAAKFRFLNEKLYTENGKESFTYFQKNNDEFLDYHIGYNLQVLKWPMNPVNKIISSLQKLDKKLIIADMGCGDAKIAQTLANCVVHSFDLVALNEHVTPCNISKVPLSNDTVDVVVFCLSLMGTNLKDYLLEAFRILKYRGDLKIAEVESRIPSLDKFIKSIESLGFTLENKDIQHKLFVFLDFKKEKKKKKMQDVVLNPCLYKKR